MQYFGGKDRIAKWLAKHMEPVIKSREFYVEPFVGAASVLTKVKGPRLASDANLALITMWEALDQGWQPPEFVSKEDWKKIKEINNPLDPLTAFIGFGCSFGGRWFYGYAKNAKMRNYAKNSANSLRKKIKNLKDVIWVFGDYRTIGIPKNSCIYCDPPYANTIGYVAVRKFNSDKFWEWCLKKHDEGHAVFVSEYNAPPEFEVSLIIPTRTDLRTRKAGREPRIEKLFVPKGSNYFKTTKGTP